MSKKYRLLITYDGTRYVGWQVQPNGPSIQGVLQQVLALLLKEELFVIGAGRTDAGVHALGQVAHFVTEQEIVLRNLLFRVNQLLPHDIRVCNVEEVDDSFHARYSAKGKEYHYHLWQEGIVPPFYRLYRTHLRRAVDPKLLQEALAYFVGRHDFCTFANVNNQTKSTVRTIYRIDLVPQEGGYRIEFEGEGFLYKMVRNIVGTALEVGQGKRSLKSLPELFAAKDRRSIGVAAPAQGLFLVKVAYEPNSKALTT